MCDRAVNASWFTSPRRALSIGKPIRAHTTTTATLSLLTARDITATAIRLRTTARVIHTRTRNRTTATATRTRASRQLTITAIANTGRDIDAVECELEFI